MLRSDASQFAQKKMKRSHVKLHLAFFGARLECRSNIDSTGIPNDVQKLKMRMEWLYCDTFLNATIMGQVSFREDPTSHHLSAFADANVIALIRNVVASFHYIKDQCDVSASRGYMLLR